MIEVSVIIPTFNRKDRLRGALQSVLSQKGVPFEVIVVDDGSTDGTREMIRNEFASITYYWQPNKGPSAARNRGIALARGHWIAFLDSDDEWLPGKLQAQVDFFTKNPEYRIAQTEEIWIRNGVRVNPMKKHQKMGGFIFKECLPLCMVSPSAVMIQKTLLDEVGTFDESLPACEDYDLWLRIAYRFPIGLLETPYVTRYGGHDDQRSRKFEGMDRFRIESLIRLLADHPLTQQQRHDARNILQKKVFIYTSGAEKRGNEKEIKRVKDLLSSLEG